jgi:hypothetical protein
MRNLASWPGMGTPRYARTLTVAGAIEIPARDLVTEGDPGDVPAFLGSSRPLRFRGRRLTTR